MQHRMKTHQLATEQDGGAAARRKRESLRYQYGISKRDSARTGGNRE